MAASDRTEVALACAAASVAVGAVYGVRTADSAGAPFPKGGEAFGYRRAFHALGYATAIVGISGALAVHAVCSHLDVRTAREFADAMRERLAAPREQLQGVLRPAGELVGASTKKVVHGDFDRWIEALQERIRPLLAVQPAPPSAGGHGASDE